MQALRRVLLRRLIQMKSKSMVDKKYMLYRAQRSGRYTLIGWRTGWGIGKWKARGIGPRSPYESSDLGATFIVSKSWRRKTKLISGLKINREDVDDHVDWLPTVAEQIRACLPHQFPHGPFFWFLFSGGSHSQSESCS